MTYVFDVCLYVYTHWCSTVGTEWNCTKPPREFPQLFIILAYICPRANAPAATDHMKNSYSPKFILGDFNHYSADKSLKGFYQYITCTTRLRKTLAKCYGSAPDAYRSVAPLQPRPC